MPWSEEFPGQELEAGWLEADRLFPEASVMWDADGPEWVAGRPHLTIVITPTGLAVGCGDRAPFGWALWNDATSSWIYL